MKKDVGEQESRTALNFEAQRKRRVAFPRQLARLHRDATMSDSGSSAAASPAPVQLQQQGSAAAPPPGDEQPADDSLETSFFPAPAPYYTRYTSDNLALPLTASVQLPNGQEVSRAELEPPNIDWIVEEGSYSVFGETWPVEEKLPSLAEMGVQELFDPTVGEF